MFRINTAAGEAMSRKGHPCYPEDFPHLPPGQDFVAWRSGEDWEIETTLEGAAFEARLRSFIADQQRYQVMTYCGDSGADDKREYSSIKEAAQAAKGYVDGTEPLSDGLRYDGAIVYDVKKRRIVIEYGHFPAYARPTEKEPGCKT